MTNNSSQPFFFDNGNVGIGTNSPITKLNIHNTSAGSSPNGNSYSWNDSLAFTGAGEAWTVGVETTSGTSFALGFFNYANTCLLYTSPSPRD